MSYYITPKASMAYVPFSTVPKADTYERVKEQSKHTNILHAIDLLSLTTCSLASST